LVLKSGMPDHGFWNASLNGYGSLSIAKFKVKEMRRKCRRHVRMSYLCRIEMSS
jgi:hypothetical protein